MRTKNIISDAQIQASLQNIAGFLSKIQAKFDGMNFFKMSGMCALETKHSAFLANMLNPNGAHCQGDLFVKSFLGKIPSLNLDATFKYDTLRVETEWKFFNERRIDILLYSEEEQTVILIENKVFADEHDDQLNCYVDGIAHDNKFKGYKDKKFIFLTPYGRSPSEDENGNWLTASYKDILATAEDVKAVLPQDSELLILLKHYTDFVEENIVMGTLLENEMQKIYNANKTAADRFVDYIMEMRSKPQIEVLKVISDILNKNSDIEFVKFNNRGKSGKGRVQFKTIYTKQLLNNDPVPVTYEINADDMKNIRGFAFLLLDSAIVEKINQEPAYKASLLSLLSEFDNKQSALKNGNRVQSSEHLVKVADAYSRIADTTWLGNIINAFVAKIVVQEKTIIGNAQP